VLTINTGSSSLRAALYAVAERETLLVSARAERIGLSQGRLQLIAGDGRSLADEPASFPDHGGALQAVLARLSQPEGVPDAVGHRVVHGGSGYSGPSLVSRELIATLEELVSIAPDHLPQAIGAIRAMDGAYPALPQVACFDTAFHRKMPLRAQRVPLPRELGDAGIVRYGFHGLSYESIFVQLRATAPTEATGRVIIAHLGNGASMVAMREGASVETTMGFTPAGGLVMGSRSGDLDPGVLLHLLEGRGMSPAALNHLINHESGLRGISGTSADMRDLLERETTDLHAAEAIELFCYQARKFLGALTAVLGGLNTLVFTGGIGEHAATVRARICEDLEVFGIRLDGRRNAASAPVISEDRSPVTVRVIKTDEDLMIARHTRAVVGA
jgi:acetate kinase